MGKLKGYEKLTVYGMVRYLSLKIGSVEKEVCPNFFI